MLIGYLATEPDKHDCSGCRKRIDRPKCFFESETIVCKGQKIKPFEVNINEWKKIIDKVREVIPDYPEHLCFRNLNVCPIPVISPLSIELLELYRACKGISVSTPADYYALPALYVNAVNVIEAELNRIKAIQQDGKS